MAKNKLKSTFPASFVSKEPLEGGSSLRMDYTGSSTFYPQDPLLSASSALQSGREDQIIRGMNQMYEKVEKMQHEIEVVSSELLSQEKKSKEVKNTLKEMEATLQNLNVEVSETIKKQEIASEELGNALSEQEKEKVKLIEMLSVFVAVVTFIAGSISVFRSDMPTEKIFLVLIGLALSLIIFALSAIALLRQVWWLITILFVVLAVGFWFLYSEMAKNDEENIKEISPTISVTAQPTAVTTK